MRLSRTDLVPVLTIVAGSAIGMFSFGALVRSAPSNDMPVPTLQLLAEDGANQELTGTWVLSVDLGRQGGGDATFVLEQDGTRISGIYSGLWGTRLKVRGTVEDGLVKFSFVSTRGVVVYEGTLEGTTLKGRCVYGQLDPGIFAGSHRS